jgi:oxalate decarboxylase
MFSLSDNVFKDTFNIPSELLKGLKTSRKHDLIHFLPANKTLPNYISSRYKFNLAASTKLIKTQGGYVQAATKENLPVLDGLGVLGFGLNPNGAVEPHWHTNAGELIYILKGKTQITVLAPDGSVDTLEVSAGEGAFAAASHFHNILNVGNDDVEVMAFFSNADPDYIGFGEVIGAYSNEVLASVFNVSPTYFDTLIKPEVPLVIVPL